MATVDISSVASQYPTMPMSTKHILRALAEKAGFHVERWPGGRPNPIHLWQDDREFQQIVKPFLPHTLVDVVRCYTIYQCARSCAVLTGNAAEVGVYRGGTAGLIRSVLPNEKILHLFDTFEGMPDTDPAVDHHRRGDFADTSINHVQSVVGSLENVRLHEGLFPKTAATVGGSVFCFVHVDVDIYRSVLDCCTFFYPRMVTGGVLLFDDYGFVSCPGAKKAVDEFFAAKPETPVYIPTGQALVVKLPS